MKESSCHDPKMVAYCQAVCLLEDKFDGLELNHITRRSNEAAYKLVKLASSQAPVLAGVFASGLYKPSVTYQGSAQNGSELLASRAGSTPAVTPQVFSSLIALHLHKHKQASFISCISL
jgi:hypothetical protein